MEVAKEAKYLERPGANALRGAKKNFNNFVRVGNWVEENYRPDIPTKRFSSTKWTSVQTEA
mgnify:CR=1 FL=1